MSNATIRSAARALGHRGARARWGGHAPTVAVLSDLSNEQRAIVWSLIRAERAANEMAAAGGSKSPLQPKSVSGGDRERPE
jgi:hypothetical protein